MLQELILKFLLASALGGLVGIEREWWREVEKRKYMIGLRTSILISIFGFLSYLVSQSFFIAGLFVVFAMGLTSYILRVEKEKYVGLTTFTAMVLIYLIGGLVIYNELFATIVTIIVVSVLFFRRKLHLFIKDISEGEIRGAVEFLIISLVILPLLPNKTIDKFHIFNPFQFWYIVVLISAIYFISYIFLRKYSKKGIFYSGLFGGLINSAATSFIISKFKKFSSGVYAAIAASVISDIISIGLIVGNYKVLVYTLPVQLLIISVLLFFGWKYSKNKIKFKMKSPLNIISSLEFAGLLFVLIVLSGLLKNVGIGLIILVFLASLYSSTTMSISIAIMNLNKLIPTREAGVLIIFATLICLLSKNIWILEGNKKERRKVLILTVLLTIVSSILEAIIW